MCPALASDGPAKHLFGACAGPGASLVLSAWWYGGVVVLCAWMSQGKHKPYHVFPVGH